jgi:hypothetical protein
MSTLVLHNHEEFKLFTAHQRIKHLLELEILGKSVLDSPDVLATLKRFRNSYLHNRISFRTKSPAKIEFRDLISTQKQICQQLSFLASAPHVCVWPFVRACLDKADFCGWAIDNRGRMVLLCCDSFSPYGLSVPALLRGRVSITKTW